MGISLFCTIEIISDHYNALPITKGCLCGTYIKVNNIRNNMFQTS